MVRSTDRAMEQLNAKFQKVKADYDNKALPIDALCDLSEHALGLLANSKRRALPSGSAGGKQYWIYSRSSTLSRPCLPNCCCRACQLRAAWRRLVRAVRPAAHVIALQPSEVNRTLYTCVMAFCLCYDLWKPTARKTPGTQFEIVLGSLLSRVLPHHKRTKHVPLPDSQEQVSTDIVMQHEDTGKALVLPAKITTVSA